MAAIVRSGARKLAGSALLQRAQPAVAGAQVQRAAAACSMSPRTQQASGPCASRFMSSTTTRLQHNARPEPRNMAEAMEEIQLQKEELYDLIEQAGLKDRDNKQLLKRLSAQIKPRPNDPKWRWNKAMELIEDLAESSIPIAGSLLLCLAMFEQHMTRTLAKEKKRQQADAAARQENLPYARGATLI